MAKFDTSKIDGYASMTAEQKLAALEAAELPEPDYSGYVKKETFDKTASDLAAWKKKYTDQLSEEERKKQENADSLAQMQKELDELRRDKVVSENKAKFLALGYDEALAEETARALSAGDNAKVFSNQQKFLNEYAKKVKAEALKDTPRPPAGGGSNGIDFDKKINEARENGDFTALAYYTRLHAEAEAEAVSKT